MQGVKRHNLQARSASSPPAAAAAAATEARRLFRPAGLAPGSMQSLQNWLLIDLLLPKPGTFRPVSGGLKHRTHHRKPNQLNFCPTSATAHCPCAIAVVLLRCEYCLKALLVFHMSLFTGQCSVLLYKWTTQPRQGLASRCSGSRAGA